MRINLLILGAGPEGCAAAVAASRAGFSVCVLETIDPRCEPGNPHVVGDLLRQSALLTGVLFVSDAEPDAVLRHGGRVAGVAVRGQEFFADWTLDATGKRGWLAARLLPSDAAGWPGEVHETKPVAFTAGQISAKGGLDLNWRLHPMSAGPGYFLLREAADSLSLCGRPQVLSLSSSGILVARLIYGCVSGKISEQEAALAYKDLVNHQFSAGDTTFRQFYPKIVPPALTRAFERARAAAES